MTTLRDKVNEVLAGYELGDFTLGETQWRLLTLVDDAVPTAGRPGSRANRQRWRMAGAGTNPGAPKGNRNAFKHGRYSAEAIAGRREVAKLIRAMRALACVTEEVD